MLLAALWSTVRPTTHQNYKEKYGVEVPGHRVVVTPGSSGAFLLIFLSAFDVGDKVAVASSSYPCYRNILDALGEGMTGAAFPFPTSMTVYHFLTWYLLDRKST